MSYETDDKMVSHPDHYKSGKYEVIDIIDEFTKDLSGTEAVCTANAIKYILRWKKKNGIQDVKKAIWYLQHLVDQEEERLQEEHAEFDEELLNKKKEFVDKAINHIRENSVYGIPKEHTEYDGPDEHCRTCKFRFETPENDEICKNCFGREKYVCDEELLKKELHCGDCNFYDAGHCKFLTIVGVSSRSMACGYFDLKKDEKVEKKGIDDEPDKLNLRKNAAGVYIPENL